MTRFTCKEDDCKKTVLAKGMCSAHYALNRRTGSTKKTYIRGTCSLSDCSEPHLAKGYCMTHYYKWKRTGDPYYLPPKAPPKRTLDKNGYAVLSNMHDHPNARKNGNIFEHVVVMAEKLGRPLVKGENVHHINGVRDDNRPENLEVWNTSQPAGQRPEDKVEWAIEILSLYKPEVLNV